MNRGGSETLMLDVFGNAARVDMDIIGIHRKGGDLYEDFMKTGWPFIQSSPKNKFDPIYFIRLRKILKENNIDLVHAQHPLDAFAAIIATIFQPIKVVITFHGFSRNKPGWYRCMLRIIFRLVSYCFFVSKSQMDHYKDKYYRNVEKKSRVIYNSIDLNKFDADAGGDIRKELGIPQELLILGSVGNFNTGRDQFTICKALKLLKDKNPDFAFLFIGARQKHKPELFDNCLNYCIENKIEKNVFFLGARKDVPSLLSQMDAFIYSSSHDTFGIAVIEAMISGTPVILNDWKVMLEISNNGEYAEVFKSKDPEDLSGKMIKFINNRSIFLEQAKSLKPLIRQKYDVVNYLQNLKSLYKEI